MDDAESAIVTDPNLAPEKEKEPESDDSVNEGIDLNASVNERIDLNAEADDVNARLLKFEDESIYKLISQGIKAEDVKRLKEADIATCNQLLLFRTKRNLNEIEGLSSDKVDKILEAAEKLVGSVSGFIEEKQAEWQRAETVVLLRSHLQSTSNLDPSVRRVALVAIKDMLMRKPEIVKPHTYAIVEAFQRLIKDEEKENQRLSYDIFDAIISNNLKEDDLSMVLRMLMQSTLEALTLPNHRTHVSAFQFLGRLVLRFPPFSPADAEKVIEMGGMFLQDDKYTIHDKSVLLDSLNSFLALLPWNKKGTNLHFDAKETDVNVQDESLVHYYGFSPVVEKMKHLVKVLVDRFLLLANTATNLLDENAFDRLASLLNGINLIVCSFTKSKYQDSIYGEKIDVWEEEVSTCFQNLFDHFPFGIISQSTDKENNDKLLDLNLVIAKTFFQCLPQYSEYLDTFLDFIGHVLDGKLCKVEESDEALWSVHLTELVYLIPRIISFEANPTNNKSSHLLKAFTHAFRESRLGSSLKLACLYVIEDMLLHMHTTYICPRISSQRKSEYVHTIIEWMREFTSLLKELSPADSLVGIRLLVSFGKWAREHSSLRQMYSKIQCSLPDFLGKCNEVGEPLNGHFLCHSTSSKEMILFCLMKFSSLDWPLLNLMLECCLSPSIDFDMISRIIEIVNSFSIPMVKVEDYINFSFSLVSRFKFSSSSLKLANLKKMTTEFGSYMKKNPVHFDGNFHIIENQIVHEIVRKPYVDNVFSLLEMIAFMDSSEVTRLNEGNLLTLRPYLFKYLKDVGELQELHQLPSYDDHAVGIQQATTLWEIAKQYATNHY